MTGRSTAPAGRSATCTYGSAYARTYACAEVASKGLSFDLSASMLKRPRAFDVKDRFRQIRLNGRQRPFAASAPQAALGILGQKRFLSPVKETVEFWHILRCGEGQERAHFYPCCEMRERPLQWVRSLLSDTNQTIRSRNQSLPPMIRSRPVSVGQTSSCHRPQTNGSRPIPLAPAARSGTVR
jgi:hypothetical protein